MLKIASLAVVLTILGAILTSPAGAQTVIAGDLSPYNGFQTSTATAWATGPGALCGEISCDPANAVAFSIPSGGSGYLMTQFKVAINWSAGTNGATVGLYASPNGNSVDAINSATLVHSFSITSPAVATGQPGQLVTVPVNPPILLTPGNTYFLEMSASGGGTDFGWQWNSIGRNNYYAEFLPCDGPGPCWFAETGVATPAFEVDGTIVAGPFAYVGNQTDDTVSVIDTSSGTVAATVTLGCGSDCGDSPAGLAVTPNGKSVYVAIPSRGEVMVIDTSSNKVSTTIPMCASCTSKPEGIAITPDGTRAYVTDAAQFSIEVIDTNPGDEFQYNTVIDTITADVGNPDGPIAITPDGSAAFYTFGGGSVGRIDTSTNNHTTTLAVGSNPTGIAVTPDGAQIYVTNSGGNTVSVIPNVFPDFSPITSVTVGTGPFSVAITPNGQSAYIVNQGDASVSVISTTSNTVTTTITGLGTTANQIAITPDGTTAYVPIGSGNVVTPIYTSTNTTQTNITVGNAPFGIAIGPAPASEQFTLDGSDQTVTAPFYNGGASINYHFPAGYCSPAPCTLNVTAVDTPDPVWQTESVNYPGTDIAPVAALPGGGNPGGDGVVYTVTCTDGNNNPCSDPNNLDYTGSLLWNTNVDICSANPALGKQDPSVSLDWKNILASCFFNPDPGSGVSGSSRGGPSHWSAFYHVTGTPSASVTITTPANGATYLLGESVLANYACSGTFVDCAGTVTKNLPIDTSTLGSKTFNAEADVTSGPTATASSTYNVTSAYQFVGFGSPISNSPTLNIAKAGQAIPVAFQVLDAGGNPVLGLTMPPVSIVFAPAPCSTLDTTGDTTINVTAAGNSGFQSLGGGNYQFNWKTPKSLFGTCGQLQVNLGDGVLHTADFKFK